MSAQQPKGWRARLCRFLSVPGVVWIGAVCLVTGHDMAITLTDPFADEDFGE